MRFNLNNSRDRDFEVWLEPWCYPYFVPPGSRLELEFTLSERFDVVEIDAQDGRIMLWLPCDYEPLATLDGKPVKPDFTR